MKISSKLYKQSRVNQHLQSVRNNQKVVGKCGVLNNDWIFKKNVINNDWIFKKN